LTMPSPTEERRKELVRVIRKQAEDFRVAVRNIRRDTVEDLKKSEKDKKISQDDLRRQEQLVQKLTDQYIKNIETLWPTRKRRFWRSDLPFFPCPYSWPDFLSEQGQFHACRTDLAITSDGFADMTRSENLLLKIQQNPIPRHIAIIMDGNGRWAKKRGLPRIYGHRVGTESVREIIQVCGKWASRY